MTVVYETRPKKVKPPQPKRYEVQWFMLGRWTHWSWHRYKWIARFEIFTGFERMRIIDHGGTNV